MSQRLALIISVALTAFVLVVAGAVIGRISQKTPTADSAAAAPAGVEQMTTGPVTTEAAAGVPAASEVSPAGREAQYQELIRQANERLQSAYEQLKEQQAAAQQPDTALLTPDQAAEIARQYIPYALMIRPPQLFDYQGVQAYNVTMDLGPLYIDAHNGEILYDGTIAPPGTHASGPGRASSPTTLRDDAPNSGDNQGGDDDREDHAGEDHGGEDRGAEN
jgi:hypothetical protein